MDKHLTLPERPDLSGKQRVMEGRVEPGDILVFSDGDSCRANVTRGMAISGGVSLGGKIAAVYRDIPVPKQTTSENPATTTGSTHAADSKDTNPKDTMGSGKLPIGLVPQSGIACEALAFLEGALKYGASNWRVMGVRSSIYFDACMRHLMKWWNGEWADPKTGVPHLGSARACLNIILDAGLLDKLTDDRPPANPALIAQIDAAPQDVAQLKALFAEHKPKHWHIGDGAPVARVNPV